MSDRAGLQAELDFLLDSIRKLGEERASGTLTDEEHETLRAQQTVKAAAVLRQLEAKEHEVAPLPGEKLLSRGKEFGRRPRWVVLAGIAAFVVLAVGGVLSATGDRLTGDTGTGGIAGDSNTLLRRAQEQTAAGRADQALRTYDAVLRLDPNNVEALAYRGWLIRLAGLPAEGSKSIDRAIELDPTYPDARFFRGIILLRDRNQPAAAVPDFEAFLANDPPEQLVPLVEQALTDARAQAAVQAR